MPLVDSPRSLEDALERLRVAPGPAIPIVDPDTGRIVAVLARPNVAPWGAPPRLGGMATPLGVYLTDGVVSGGAGFWGLFLTGVTLGAMALLVQAAVDACLSVARAHGCDVWGWIEGPSHSAVVRDWLATLMMWLPVPLIFVMLRLAPMSGTHAAEHQVVHCVERDAPLTADWVRTMPRVHPRCGTNLFVGASLFLLIFVGVFGMAVSDRMPVEDGAVIALVLAAVPALTLWRRLGAFVQQWLATRPATDRQIAGAIRAAEEVLERRARSRDAVRFRLLRRIWSMGLAQVLLGYAALLGPLTIILDHFPAMANWLGV